MRCIVGAFLFGLGLTMAGFGIAAPPGGKETTYRAPVEKLGGGGDDIVYTLPPEEMLPEGISFISAQTPDWSHKTLSIPEAHALGKGKGAKIAILDTGIDTNHPEFRGRIVASKDFTGSRSGVADVNGHGTHCAGIAAAGDDGEGTIGIAPEASIVVGKVLGDNGSGLTTWIANAIKWAVDDQGVDVISMSLGSSSYDERLHTAVKYAVSKGVIVCAAAGNEGPGSNTVGYPGGHPETICVASIGQSGVVSRFSSRGPELFLAAPGEQILATYPGGRYARLSGTSMATPAVAGEVAVIQAYRKAKGLERLSPAELKEILKATIFDIDPKGKDTGTGFGMPRLKDAMLKATEGIMPPPTDPPVDPPTPPVPPTPGAFFVYLKDLSADKQKEVLAKWPNFSHFEFRDKVEVIVHVK